MKKGLSINHQLIIIAIFSFLIKLYFISDNHIYFGFDQARDAIISRSILEKGDLKIQGPTASGTGDQIFHGVLYYYIIAPFYTAFQVILIG